MCKQRDVNFIGSLTVFNWIFLLLFVTKILFANLLGDLVKKLIY
ncbi:hypothetical protein [Azospirillum melinis]